MPDNVHHPVLIVKANDLPQRRIQQQQHQQQQQQQNCDAAPVSVVRRMRLDGSASSSFSSYAPPPPPLADGNFGDNSPVRAGTPFVFASPHSFSLSRSVSSPSFGVVPAISDERQTRSVDISDDDDEEDDFGFANGRNRFAYMPPTPPKKRMVETPQSLFQQSFGTQRLSNMLASTLAQSNFDDDDGALSFSCQSECSCICKHNSMPLSGYPAADIGVVDIAALSGGDTQDLGEANTVIPPSVLLSNLRDGTQQATRSSSSDSTSTHIDDLALAPSTGKMAFQILCDMTEETAPLASSKGARSAKESVSRNSMLSLVSDQDLARV
ncbi:hypothetical protein GGI22_008026, partial [Coemansia erecta]